MSYRGETVRKEVSRPSRDSTAKVPHCPMSTLTTASPAPNLPRVKERRGRTASADRHRQPSLLLEDFSVRESNSRN